MLTKIEVHNSLGDILELPLFDSQQAPIQIHDVDGLGPVKAAINLTPFGAYDGENYTGSSRASRNIVLKVGLNPNWIDQTISSLRHLVYQYLFPQELVDIYVTSDDLPLLKISGYVESCEPNMFSQDPEMQISILCPLPDLVSTVVKTAQGGTSLPVTVTYAGTVPTGFTLRLDAPTGIPSYTGAVVVQNQSSRYTPAQAFNALNVTVDSGHYFLMSTIRGKKSAKSVTTAGVATDIMKRVQNGTVWPALFRGPNPISVPTIGGGGGLIWTLTYSERFGGI